MHTIQCQCGTVRAQLQGTGISSRVLCYCTDCRAFARFLGQSEQIMDRQGGTEIVQVSQGRLHFIAGKERLKAVRLSDKGMVRWYADCCKTPFGNIMANRNISFVGLIHTALDHARMDEDFGKVIAVANVGTALGDPKPKAVGVPGIILRFIRLVASARLSGEYRNSPFFDSSGALIAQPTVLGADALALLKRDG